MKIKDIALSAAYVGQRVVKAICVGAQEIWSAVKYIVFKDKVVEQICATNWGDGVGITEEQAAKVTNLGTVFQNNSEITSFDEFKEFVGITYISQPGFYQCTALAQITLPTTVTRIGVQVFQSCAFTSIHIPRNVTEIDSFAFFVGSVHTIYIDSLEQFFSIKYGNPNSMPYGSRSEDGTVTTNLIVAGEVLSNIVVPTTATKIPACAFVCSANLRSIRIQDGVTEIGERAFAGCKLLEEVTLPNTLKTIGQNAFRKSSIKEVRVPEGVTTIAAGTFESCGKLQFVELPSTITSIGNTVFFAGSSGRTLVIHATVPPSVGAYGLGFSYIYVPDQSVTAYREASGWLDYADRIKPLSQYVES